jgi:hypothetical protein
MPKSDCLRSSRISAECSRCHRRIEGLVHTPLRNYRGLWCGLCCPCCNETASGNVPERVEEQPCQK